MAKRGPGPLPSAKQSVNKLSCSMFLLLVMPAMLAALAGAVSIAVWKY